MRFFGIESSTSPLQLLRVINHCQLSCSPFLTVVIVLLFLFTIGFLVFWLALYLVEQSRVLLKNNWVEKHLGKVLKPLTEFGSLSLDDISNQNL